MGREPRRIRAGGGREETERDKGKNIDYLPKNIDYLPILTGIKLYHLS